MKKQVEGQLALSVAASPVSRSVLPGSEEAVKMTVTSGRKCCGLLKNSDPIGLLAKMCLESSIWRSTRCLLTWKISATPDRRLYFRLVPQTPRTDGTEFALWATAMTDSAIQKKKRYKQGGLPLAMAISKEPVMWKTPIASDGNNRQFYRNSRGEPNLSGMVKLWPTPSTQELEHPDAVLTESGRRATKSGESSHSLGLADTVRLFPSPTPTERKSAGSGEKCITSTGTIRRKNANGTTSNMGLSATVASEGQLNPDWVEWLMGFPLGWTDPEREVDKSTLSETGHWLPEPDIPRVAVGVKDRVNRLKCLGNAVVPQQFYPVFQAIAEIESEEKA